MLGIKKFSAIILTFVFFSGCTKAIHPTQDFILMDTFVHIEIKDNLSRDLKARAINKAIAKMKELERRFNYFLSENELARINSLRAGEVFSLSDEMFRVLTVSRKICHQTNGAFDVTIAPLLEIWLSLKKGHDLPTPEEIKTIKELVGLGNWILNEKKKTVSFKKEGVKLNLGGIAKGFIVDSGIRVLEEMGITNTLINAGGDIYCTGEGSGGGWIIGIRDPERPREIIARFQICDKGVATSGGYERFTEFKGKKFSHIIDPRTGCPIENLLKSVTVVAADCMTADALATALYVLGPEEGLLLIESIDGAECFIVDETGEVYISSGLKKFGFQSPQTTAEGIPRSPERSEGSEARGNRSPQTVSK